MTLMKFIDKYIEEGSNGGRQTANGTNYSPNTVKSIKQALTQFRNFCKWKKKEYDFDDIDNQFYYDDTADLNKDLKDHKSNVTEGLQRQFCGKRREGLRCDVHSREEGSQE